MPLRTVETVPITVDRKKLRAEAIEDKSASVFPRRWDVVNVDQVKLAKNKSFERQTVEAVAKRQGKDGLDCFLDLSLEENLETRFSHITTQGDPKAVCEILKHPAVVVGQSDAGAYAVAALLDQVRTDDFPLLLAAEWGHHARLIAALNGAGLTTRQKVTLIGLIGTTQSVETVPTLTRTLNDADPAVAEASAAALGAIGHENAIPPLLALYSSPRPEQRRCAVAGLGRLAPLHPSSAIVPTLLTGLPNEPVPTQILIVRSLGKTTDRRILEPLRALHRSVLKRSPEQMTPDLKELKSTLGIALDQFDGTHTEE